jgi:hypothetical protein
VIVVSDLGDVAPPGVVEGGLGGSHHKILEMVFSSRASCGAVALVTRFKVHEALFGDLD